ncbi:MAG TPA: prepilin peptidase [Clostridiales bacterium]|nr:prepilin peptidase [Clostridiales bacterium]
MVIKITAIVLTLLIGLCVGSFLNVVIYRLPNNMSLVSPASHCPKCDYKLKWYDNVPLLSYIFLRGRCRNCKSKISIRYPLIEFSNMALWFLALMLNTNFIISSMDTNYLMFGLTCVAFSILLCIFCCDLDNMEIPDEFQLSLLILGIVGFLSVDISASSKVYGFLLGGGFLGIFALMFYLIRKKEGLGIGDIKLMAVLGLFMGLQNIIICLILSTISGAIVLSILAIKNRKGEKNKEYPFATFIVPSAVISILVGDYIASWYLSLFAVV